MRLGLEKFVDEPPSELRGARLGLLMNRASVDRDLRLACDVVAEAYPGQLTALFSPQHGLWGDAQANMIETDHDWHRQLNLPIYSLYSQTRSPTPEMLSKIDCLVVDLQDVGTRVYTFIWTLLECLQACAAADVRLHVLDRPNPIGGTIVEGPLLEPSCQSFVGGATIPMRHGLSIGELAGLLNHEQSIGANLSVTPMLDWSPAHFFSDLGRHWIPPSPNLPRIESTVVYPGQVLSEGTNLSEGRGTTIPFEVIGAPFVQAEVLLRELQSFEIPGVKFLPIQFRPTFDKWVGRLCGGVSIHVTDPKIFRSYRTTVTLLAIIEATWPHEFRWLDPPYEYETEKPPVDIISGSDRLRKHLAVDEVEQLCSLDAVAWKDRTRPFRLYHEAC